ncbi:MAG: c-type cytochrome [Oceanicaulis sp.]
MIALIALSLLQAAPDAAGAEPEAAALAELEARGRRLFLRCQACHALADGEPHKVGPSLYGFWGEPAASREGFGYSDALASAEIVWDAESLHAFLERPSRAVPGTTMAFAGLSREADRDAVIAYMRAQTGAED